MSSSHFESLAQFESEATSTEIFLGRALAMCVHPWAAWRRSSASARVGLLTAYAAAAYVIVLGALLTLQDF